MAPKASRKKSPKAKAKATKSKGDRDATPEPEAKATPTHSRLRGRSHSGPSIPKLPAILSRGDYRGPRPDEELLHVAFMDAVARKQTDISHIYRMMYEGEEDLNQRTIHGFTPLAVATASGDAELVVLLLERRANPAISSIDKGEVPLHHAAFYGRSTVVRLLIGPTKEAGALDATSTSGLTALMVAARVNNLEGLKAMLIAGASASSTNALHGGATALHDAVAAGHFEVAETLLDYEADVNALDMQSRGPLFAASRFCALDCVGLLLRYKADANAQDRQGIFPLDLVPLEHPLREKVVQLLCAYAHQPPVPFRGDARFDLKSKTLGELI